MRGDDDKVTMLCKRGTCCMIEGMHEVKENGLTQGHQIHGSEAGGTSDHHGPCGVGCCCIG